MYAYCYENNLEAEVMSAGPIRLVQMLYRGALDATTAARSHLQAGEIAARSRQITKAQAILTELSTSLDHVRGGTIATHLSELYAYMQQRLTDANFRQADEPLAETERLLETLTEAWEQCAPESEPTQFQFAMSAVRCEYRSYDLVG
jgi:flagellar secretion chaperone FliS